MTSPMVLTVLGDCLETCSVCGFVPSVGAAMVRVEVVGVAAGVVCRACMRAKADAVTTVRTPYEAADLVSSDWWRVQEFVEKLAVVLPAGEWRPTPQLERAMGYRRATVRALLWALREEGRLVTRPTRRNSIEWAWAAPVSVPS